MMGEQWILLYLDLTKVFKDSIKIASRSWEVTLFSIREAIYGGFLNIGET